MRPGAIPSSDLAAWVVGHYPRRRYPVAFIGSTNGAAVHLAAALGAPWLPQTLLIPVRRRGIDPDDSPSDLRFGKQPGHELLRANPDLALHHMNDPNQDRLMGATLVVLDCTLRWPRTGAGTSPLSNAQTPGRRRDRYVPAQTR